MKGKILKITSVLLIAAAIILLEIAAYLDIGWSIRNQRAGRNAARLLEQAEAELASDGLGQIVESPEDTDLAQEDSSSIPQLITEWGSGDKAETTGYAVAGVLMVPELEIHLPILAPESWNESLMDYGPCIYYGSMEGHNLILAGHDYASHFLPLLDAKEGMKVWIRTEGAEYCYKVTAVEEMHRSETDRLYQGDWDLTLFTCVPQTFNRLAVRCELIETRMK